MIIFTKNELNTLIRNYLDKEGYYHSRFAFTNEIIIKDCDIQMSLDDIVLKGIQYLYVEKHIINERYVPCENNFTICETHRCIENDDTIENKKEENSVVSLDDSESKKRKTDSDLSGSKDEMYKVIKDNVIKDIYANTNIQKTNNEIRSGLDDSINALENSNESKKSLKLGASLMKDHTGDVSLCAWKNDILATGSDDHTVRIFKDGKQILERKVNAEVTALEWYDNALSVGNYIGEVHTIKKDEVTVSKNHTGPVFALKYNKTLLSVGYDGKAYIDNKAIKIHSKAILDCDFLNYHQFITCSSDFNIGLVNLQTQDIEYLSGHVNEINCISQKDNIIASSSDDCSVILWNVNSRKNITLNNHTNNVYQHKFFGKRLISVGNDGRVNNWDVMKGCLNYKYEHEKGVYGVDVIENHNLIITGGGDRNVIFYDDRVGEIKRYTAKGSIYDIKVSGSGNFLCVCMADSSPILMDMRYN